MAYDDVYNEDDRRSALTQGLLGAGLAMLGARKGQEFNAFAQAGLLGLGGYNTSLRDATNARDEQAQRRMREQQYAMQMAEYQRQQQERAGMRAAAGQAFVGGSPGRPAQEADNPGGTYMPPTAAQPGRFDPQAYIAALQRQGMPEQAIAAQDKYAPKRIAPDAPKPEHFTPQSMSAFAQTGDWNALVPVTKPDASPVGKVNPSDFTAPSVKAFFDGGGRDYSLLVPIDKRPVSNVSIRNVAETEESKAIGKGRGEAFVATQAGATKARAKLNSLSAIDSLVGDVETSPLTPIGMKAASVFEGAFGVKVDKDLPRKQAAETIMSKLALDARSTADGGGMPGAMSDADREFLRNMNPTLSQTKEGRALIVKVHTRMAKREQDLARWANEYRLGKGQFDEGFQDYAAQKSEKSPLFADLAGQMSAPVGGVVDFNTLRQRRK